MSQAFLLRDNKRTTGNDFFKIKKNQMHILLFFILWQAVSAKSREQEKEGENVKIGTQFSSHGELLRMATLAKQK